MPTARELLRAHEVATEKRVLEDLRRRARELKARLGLTSTKNEDVLRVDEWVADPATLASYGTADGASAELCLDAGALLGEILVQRHNGKWSITDDALRVVVQRNGVHVIDPMGKVAKRLANGPEDNLVGLLKLTQRLVDAAPMAAQASAPTARPEGTMSGTQFLVRAIVVLVVLGVLAMVLAVKLL